MPTPSPELLVVVVVLGLLGLAVTVWVFWPAFRGPEAARRDLGTHRLAIGAVIAVLVLSNLVALLLNPFLHLERALSSSSFIVVALLTGSGGPCGLGSAAAQSGSWPTSP